MVRFLYQRWHLLFLLLLVLTGLSLYCLSGKSQITEADYQEINTGMTLKEVKAIFGRDPDAKGQLLDVKPWLSDLEFSLWSDHLRQDSPRAYKDLLERLKDKVQVKYIFDGVELDGNTVAVSFDSHGRVNAKHFRPSYAPRSLYDEIRDWIRSKLSP